jgi:hypothetical protein
MAATDPTDPTDRQLRAAIYRIARTYLEIERGLRPPEHLESVLTPAEYRRHRHTPSPARTRTGDAVLPTDIGHIHLDRHLPGQITATLPTRETGQHWGALVLHLARRHTGRWRIDQLERLTRPSVAREPTRNPPAAEVKGRPRTVRGRVATTSTIRSRLTRRSLRGKVGLPQLLEH